MNGMGRKNKARKEAEELKKLVRRQNKDMRGEQIISSFILLIK